MIFDPAENFGQRVFAISFNVSRLLERIVYQKIELLKVTFVRSGLKSDWSIYSENDFFKETFIGEGCLLKKKTYLLQGCLLQTEVC